jgi:hypothetical protein
MFTKLIYCLGVYFNPYCFETNNDVILAIKNYFISLIENHSPSYEVKKAMADWIMVDDVFARI